MTNYLNKVYLPVLLLALSGCGGLFDYDGLKQTKIEGQGFHQELGRAYQRFAVYEADEMFDWTDAAHFGEKALKSARGEKVGPENLDDWRLPVAVKPVLAVERRRLIHLLSPDTRLQSPEAAATAQASFDCWVEQQEENWQADHIAKCRDAYYSAASRLEQQLGQILGGGSELPQIRPVVQAGPPFSRQTGPRSFTLLFGFDSAEIDLFGRTQIDDVVDTYEDGSPLTIVIHGHADRAGPDPYNVNLSRRRAEAVRKLLLERGVPVQLISSQAFGEGSPRVKTANGVREPKNRRVDITIGRSKSL